MSNDDLEKKFGTINRPTEEQLDRLAAVLARRQFTIDGRDQAKARDEWFASDEGQECTRGAVSGHYLNSRLQRAFIAGIDAALRLLNEGKDDERAAGAAKERPHE